MSVQESEEYIQVLKDQIQDLKNEITVLKVQVQYLEEQHNTDLQIIELYREFVHDEPEVQPRIDEEGK